MSRKVDSQFVSPFSSDNGDQIPIQSFPPFILRGIVRGLLYQICLQHRGKELTIRWLDRAESRIMSIARGQMSHIADKQLTEDQTSWLRLNIEKEVQRIILEMGKHSYFTMKADSKFILAALTRGGGATQERVYDKLPFGLPYDQVARDYQRLEWLNAELPDILKCLDTYTFCLALKCKRECGLPSQQTLSQWAARPDAGTLRNNILGHFHGFSPNTVRRLLSDSP